MNFVAAHEFIEQHRSEIVEKAGGKVAADKIISRMLDIAKIAWDTAQIELKRLTGGYNEEQAHNIEHLKAQAVQNIDLLINDCPADLLSLVIWFILNIVLKI